jgi:formamidopyrimidine-DNA glycosylase
MPELPEVETLRRDLVRRLAGAEMGALWSSGLPLRLGRPLNLEAIAALTVGHRVLEVRRQAKYLLVYTSAGGALVVHLGMTGHLLVCPADSPRAPHTHLIWTLDRNRELRYVDPRRFGQVTTVLRGEERLLAELGALGLEPLGRAHTTERLAALLRATARPLKAFLLDQSRIAGLGNIYVCEALFLAGLHPSLPSRLAVSRAAALRDAIRTVLSKGIANRGTTIRDYSDSSGREGANQHSLHVYGREDMPCTRCGTPIRRQVDSARSSFFCPRCQPPTSQTSKTPKSSQSRRSIPAATRSKKARAKRRSGIR